jgi:SagB-type dehydrogenase family enzyme
MRGISRRDFIKMISGLGLWVLGVSCARRKITPAPVLKEAVPEKGRIKLPEPRYSSDVSVEETMLKRRSRRDYTGEPLTLWEVSQLLWAAQGITANWGGRTAPSAGATYPLETYVAVGDVKGLEKGVYKYKLREHELEKVLDGDKRMELAIASLGQPWVKEGAIDLVFTAIYERTTGRYGKRGIRYVHMEVGHVGQNVYLQAEALDLATVVIGAFFDGQVKSILNLPENEHPLYIMPVGRR